MVEVPRSPKSRRAGIRLVVLAAVASTLLAGCVGIPSSGGVNVGPAVVSGGDSSHVDLPLGPPKNASKNEIFTDFLQAATSSDQDYRIAKEFLTAKAAQGWDPTKSVLVREKPASPQDAGGDTVTYTVSTKASVDALGDYTEQATDSNETLDYSFAKVGGQWRISALPDGIVLSRDNFENSFSEYPLYFYDPDFRYLVPDVRFFPNGAGVADRIVNALLAGPSAWLQGGVVSTAFPADVKIGSPVVVKNATARVDFSSTAASAGNLVRARMLRQLQESLQDAFITNVTMTAHGAPVTFPDSEQLTTVPALAESSAPLILKDKQFGFYPRMESLGPISAGVAALHGTAATLDHAQTAAAVLAHAGVYAVAATGVSKLVDSRPGLIAPSIDSSGFIWTVPSNNASAIEAISANGTSHPIASTIPSHSSIVSLDVSHDGTRLVAYIATNSGPQLIVAGILRRAGVPTSLGPLLELPVSSAQPIDATWVDATTVAALTSNDLAGAGGDTVISYVIGGSPGDPTTTNDAVRLVGGLDADSLRLITASGQIQELRASGWQNIKVVASILATQQ
jgi:hypothetical protein